MRLGILSDIHSNPFALNAVLKDFKSYNVELVLCAGDIFGYYPWEEETFAMLQHLNWKAVLGNHDRLILEILGCASYLGEKGKQFFRSVCYEAELLIGQRLSLDGRRWLISLPLTLEFNIGEWIIKMVHGRPDDLLEGRFYPDNTEAFNWFPGKREILILGHTHYPLIKKMENGGLLLNAGSVGQPRDGDPRPSWLLLDIDPTGSSIRQPIVHRVAYNQFEAMAILQRKNWPKALINALNKTSQRLMDQGL